MIHESWAKELIVHRSVHVPDQKLGEKRTRVLLSQDDCSNQAAAAAAANLPEKFKVDNFLASSTIGAPPAISATVNQASINDNPLDEVFQSDSIIGDNYPAVEPEIANDGIP